MGYNNIQITFSYCNASISKLSVQYFHFCIVSEIQQRLCNLDQRLLLHTAFFSKRLPQACLNVSGDVGCGPQGGVGGGDGRRGYGVEGDRLRGGEGVEVRSAPGDARRRRCIGDGRVLGEASLKGPARQGIHRIASITRYRHHGKLVAHAVTGIHDAGRSIFYAEVSSCVRAIPYPSARLRRHLRTHPLHQRHRARAVDAQLVARPVRQAAELVAVEVDGGWW